MIDISSTGFELSVNMNIPWFLMGKEVIKFSSKNESVYKTMYIKIILLHIS